MKTVFMLRTTTLYFQFVFYSKQIRPVIQKHEIIKYSFVAGFHITGTCSDRLPEYLKTPHNNGNDNG